MREGLPLSGSLQSALRRHQVQQLHLVTTARGELEEEPLEDALGLVAEHRAEETQTGRGVLTQLPQQLAAAHGNDRGEEMLERARSEGLTERNHCGNNTRVML